MLSFSEVSQSVGTNSPMSLGSFFVSLMVIVVVLRPLNHIHQWFYECCLVRTHQIVAVGLFFRLHQTDNSRRFSTSNTNTNSNNISNRERVNSVSSTSAMIVDDLLCQSSFNPTAIRIEPTQLKSTPSKHQQHQTINFYHISMLLLLFLLLLLLLSLLSTIIMTTLLIIMTITFLFTVKLCCCCNYQ